jgi:hypothetical protein
VAQHTNNPAVFRDKLAEIMAEDKDVEDMDKLPDVKRGVEKPSDVKKGIGK